MIALLTLSASGLLNVLLNLLILALVLAIVWWIIGLFPVPETIRKIILAIIALIAVIYLLTFLTGCSVEFRADGTRKVSFTPTVEDYKAVRNFSRR